MAEQRILVTGGSGFLGSRVCQAAADRGFSVTALSLDLPARKLPGVNYLVGDLVNTNDVTELLAGCRFEYVVNCGGFVDHRPYSAGGLGVIRAHLDGIHSLLSTIERTALLRFVQIGSSDEYGNALAPQCETMREAPISPYSYAKTAATHLLQMLWRTEHVPVVILRLFLVYGPGQDEKRFLPQIIRGCLEDRCFPVSDGRQLRDFCFVDDVAQGVMRALDAPHACGQVINLASGEPVSIRAMVERVRDMVGKGQPDFGKVAYRTGENMALWADVTLARTLLSWAPHVSLEEGLRGTVDYYRRCGHGS